MTTGTSGVEVRGPVEGRMAEVLTPEALAFVARLEREFGGRRKALLGDRAARQARIDAGEMPDFPAATRAVREGDWRVAPPPGPLVDRRVEITGPTDRKMVINALNSGASTYMADFEDANTPTWQNMVEGQVNLIDAIERRIEFRNPDGRTYRLNEKVATLIVRPRGWHLPEKHLLVDGAPVSGSLFDFGLYFFHNARRLLEKGLGPYFYLPKIESHLEARLWRDVFAFAEDQVGVPRGTTKATVLVETILAAYEMDEILYELREHSCALNAGRWDYIFSIIKKFRNRGPEFLLPDRAQVTMTVPFMRAYTELLIRTCHRRGAYAIGGMAAFIPSRRDPKVNEVALPKVREDKRREASDGMEGTWVAHPDLVAIAKEEFDKVLGSKPNQLDRLREEVRVEPRQLLDLQVPGGSITEAGLRNNVSVAIQYLESWLRGNGAAAIFNLMEDAATAEISRSQVWHWIRYGAKLAEGPAVTRDLVRKVADEEMAKVREALGARVYDGGRFADARALFEEVALGEDYPEFLTIPAYERIA
ncbi:MAG TPA: malate synthase A [Thermodesulfobacteriota bacterium]